MIPLLFLQACSKDNDDVIEEVNFNSTTNLVTDWNDLWLELDRYAEGMRPTSTARALAYIHLAGYETAVYDMEGYVSNGIKLQGLTIDKNQREANVNLNLALNTCYALVFDHFMINIKSSIDAKIEELKSLNELEFSADLNDSEIENSIAWGTYVANQVIAYSQTDIKAEAQIFDPQPTGYNPPIGIGYWTFSAEPERALFPYWGEVRTFIISSAQTTSEAPRTPYSEDPSSDFYAEMNEVYVVSTNAKLETNNDLWIAEYWSDDVEGMMMSPPGRHISIANQLIKQYELGFERSLGLLLKLGFSLNDAAVSCWADKFEYMTMRPSVYIQLHIDADYQTNLFKFINWPNPSFPGYPSGHSTFATAAGGILIDEFGDNIDFTDRSHEGRIEFKGSSRHFTSITEMYHENAYSRLPLGVHIKMDCDEGYRLGSEISNAVLNYNLRSSN